MVCSAFSFPNILNIFLQPQSSENGKATIWSAIMPYLYNWKQIYRKICQYSLKSMSFPLTKKITDNTSTEAKLTWNSSTFSFQNIAQCHFTFQDKLPASLPPKDKMTFKYISGEKESISTGKDKCMMRYIWKVLSWHTVWQWEAFKTLLLVTFF